MFDLEQTQESIKQNVQGGISSVCGCACSTNMMLNKTYLIRTRVYSRLRCNYPLFG